MKLGKKIIDYNALIHDLPLCECMDEPRCLETKCLEFKQSVVTSDRIT